MCGGRLGVARTAQHARPLQGLLRFGRHPLHYFRGRQDASDHARRLPREGKQLVWGCVVRARPIGALHLRDSKGEEHNVLAGPDDDPRSWA